MALEDFSLPIIIVSQADVSRLERELTGLDDYISQAKLRQPGSPLERLPKTSRGLNDFAELNKLNFLVDEDRRRALDFLMELAKVGLVVHIGFAADPSSAFLAKITTWFRQNIDHLILVNVGLEPTIAAGCTLRTDNHFHDFSLRHHFEEQRPLLLSKLRESS